MVGFILIIAYLKIASSSVILVAPKLLRRIIDFFSIGSRLYLAGVLRLVLGVLLLLSATQARLWGYVVTLGLVVAASGISCFFLALRRTKKLLARLRNQSNPFLRLYAIIGLLIWLVLIYAFLPGVIVLIR